MKTGRKIKQMEASSVPGPLLSKAVTTLCWGHRSCARGRSPCRQPAHMWWTEQNRNFGWKGPAAII